MFGLGRRKEDRLTADTAEKFEDGKAVEYRHVDWRREYGAALERAPLYRKTAIVEAVQHLGDEPKVVSTSQDSTQATAVKGDWLIHNPGDKDPYVFEAGKGTVEERSKNFDKKYGAIPGQPGKFQSKGNIRALRLDENISFDTDWGERMYAKAGSYISSGGYTIAEDSFFNSYEPVLDPETIAVG